MTIDYREIKFNLVFSVPRAFSQEYFTSIRFTERVQQMETINGLRLPCLLFHKLNGGDNNISVGRGQKSFIKPKTSNYVHHHHHFFEREQNVYIP